MPEATPKSILSLVNEQGRRIASLEREVARLKGRQIAPVEEPVEEQAPSGPGFEFPKISFTTFVTTAGVIGLIIGLISFFAYAISNHWIGEMGQIMIGMTVGLVLFVLGYLLHEKHPSWSITSFGGAIFIEYLSIGYGVWGYENIPPGMAFALLTTFLIIGMVVSLKYDSLFIGYWAMIGGFIIPPLAHFHDYPLLTFLFVTALAAGILVVSFIKDWSSIRLVSYLFIVGYSLWGFSPLGQINTSGGITLGEIAANNSISGELSLLFLALYFVIFNLAPIIYSVRQEVKIKIADIITLNLNTFMSSIMLVQIIYGFDTTTLSRKILGVLFVMLSFLLLAETYFVKKASGRLESKATIYSVLTSAIILLNVGLVLIFTTGDVLKLVLLALPQWALFSYLAKISKEDSLFYSIFRYIFLGLVTIWWLAHLTLQREIAEATFIIVAMIVFLAAIYYFVSKDINEKFNGVLLVVFGFFFAYSLLRYIDLFLAMSSKLRTALLSGIWLVLSLLLYVKGRDSKELKSIKVTAFVLLIITLLKIAFYDLLLLSGWVRILGFTIFGILLLVGGLMLKND